MNRSCPVACEATWHSVSCWRIFRVTWIGNERMDRELVSLPEMIDWLECRERWKSVPATDGH